MNPQPSPITPESVHQLLLIGGGGHGPGALPDAAPKTEAFWPWIIANLVDPRAKGVILRGACGLSSNPPECGPTYYGASYKPEVDTPVGLAARGQDFLADTFAAAWGPWIKSNPTKPVVAYIGPVPAAERSTPDPLLYARYVQPFACAGAIVAMDSLLSLKAGSPSHRLAVYCLDFKGQRLWGESAEAIGQSFWLRHLGGVICQTNGLDAMGTRDDRMKAIYADPDGWMIRRDLVAMGVRAIGTVAIDDKARRQTVIGQVRARGWELCAYTYDL